MNQQQANKVLYDADGCMPSTLMDELMEKQSISGNLAVFDILPRLKHVGVCQRNGRNIETIRSFHTRDGADGTQEAERAEFGMLR